MADNKRYTFPADRAWKTMREVKDSEISGISVTAGEEATLIDLPLKLNLKIIPRVFTKPFQAIGLVSSIFSRMLGLQINLYAADDDQNQNDPR